MKILIPSGGHITISQEAAKKIRQGYSYTLNEDYNIVIGDRTEFDLEAFEKELDKTASLNPKDLKDFIKYLIKHLEL